MSSEFDVPCLELSSHATRQTYVFFLLIQYRCTIIKDIVNNSAYEYDNPTD